MGIEEGIRQYYEDQYRKEQQERRRQQQQFQQRKQLEEARHQVMMIKKKKEEQERMERIAVAAMAERKRKQLAHLLVPQDQQQRKRNELAAAYLLAQQDQENHHRRRRRQQYEQEVEYARRQELARQRKMANHRQAQQKRLDEHIRKDCQQDELTIAQLKGESNQSLLFPFSKLLNANNDHDNLRLPLNPRLSQSNDDSMKEVKSRDTRPTNKKSISPSIASSVPLGNSRRTKQSPRIHERNGSTQRECCANGDGIMEEKMINPPAVTFHNCFNIHSEPKTLMSENVPKTSLRKSVPSIESKKASKKMKSSVLIGDVEDASDDECDEDPVWNNRRPSEGQWMEPVLYEMVM